MEIAFYSRSQPCTDDTTMFLNNYLNYNLSESIVDKISDCTYQVNRFRMKISKKSCHHKKKNHHNQMNDVDQIFL